MQGHDAAELSFREMCHHGMHHGVEAIGAQTDPIGDVLGPYGLRRVDADGNDRALAELMMRMQGIARIDSNENGDLLCLSARVFTEDGRVAGETTWSMRGAMRDLRGIIFYADSV